MNRNVLLNLIKEAVIAVEPGAEITLYGSRSRGDSTPESDWDLLILIDDDINDERIDRIRYQLYEIEWESGEIISSIIRNRRKWHNSPYNTMPFYNKVENEGVLL
jgi:predicted nucleotidyltransferase